MIMLEPMTLAHADDIALLLNTDQDLHDALGLKKPMRALSPQEYYDICLAWQERKRGTCYVILYVNEPVGSISLSPAKNNGTAVCGALLKSSLWNQGIMPQAFGLIKNIAVQKGYSRLTAMLQQNETPAI